jgi:beta-glucosidase
VLLKNDGGLLPLRKDLGTVAVLGPLASSTTHPLGCWDARGDSSDVVSLLDGVRRAVGQRTKILTAHGCGIDDMSTAGFAEARELATRADAVILALGEARSMSGEASNRSSLELPGVQQSFLEAMMAVGKPVVLVLMNGRPLSISWAAEHVPAVVEGWFGGVEAGNALADVLFGDVNPSGRLPVTFPRTVGQVPIYYNHKNTGRPPSEDYFTSKYLDLPSSPLFPFGHGLSYTTFEYSPVRISAGILRMRDTLHVSVDVTNTGTREGEEVVQLYVRDVVGTVTRPVQELKGIRRISLRAGKSASVTFLLTSSDLSFWNSKMEFAPEPGTFEVMVGGNSVNGVRGSFELVPR